VATCIHLLNRLREVVVAEVDQVQEMGRVKGAHTQEIAGPAVPTHIPATEEASHPKDMVRLEALMEDRRLWVVDLGNTGLGPHHDQARMGIPMLIIPAAPAALEVITLRELALFPRKEVDIQEESTPEGPRPQDPKDPQDPKVLEMRPDRVPVGLALLLQDKLLGDLKCIAQALHQAQLLLQQPRPAKHQTNKGPQHLKIWVFHRVNRTVIV
jgi:hypothetical protein